MLEPIKPESEEDRLNELRALEILDTPDEERFSRITRIAKVFFGVDVATISFVDAERQWFKGMQGLEVCETSRDVSFCGHTILQGDLLIVSDAKKDERFFDNPLVTGPPYISFYAGVPITGSKGHRVGTLCIINQEPMQLNNQQKKFLKDLASWVEVELDFTRINSIFSELKDSQERFKLATQSAKIGVWDWAIDTNALIWDERMYALYGTRKENFSGAYEAWVNGLHPEDRERAVLELQTAVKNKKKFDTEFRVLWPDKSVHYIKAFGIVRRDENDVAINVIGVNWDVTLQKEQEARIEKLTICDDLTGLYNRRGFKTLAEQKIKELDRLKSNTMIVLADIDKMKDINDEQGHIVGDEALKAAAHLLLKSFRETDIICRWGGDEFVILVVGATHDILNEVTRRLEANLHQYNSRKHQTFQLDMSLGKFIKNSSEDMSLTDLIQAADTKMYEVKSKKCN